MTEFNLSDRRQVDAYNDERVYSEEDVKEFIKELKKELCSEPVKIIGSGRISYVIDKLAGDKLI